MKKIKKMENIKKVEWILRIAMFGEFLGHGIFALQLKTRFIELLTAMTGIANPLASKILLSVGILDVFTAVMALVFPFRLLLIWGALWGLLTAIARPVGGDPIWDFVERWANWGVPLAILYVRGIPKKVKELFK